jgi:uncharacterized protein
MRDFAENRHVKTVTRLSRDPGDDFMLAFAKENKLDFLITGDKDLLVLSNHLHTQILTFEQFLEVVNYA